VVTGETDLEATTRIEQALEAAIAAETFTGSPPRLAAAIRYAVFPAGARIRPRLCLAVAAGCGESHDLDLAESAAVAIELLHCASLVHDDLPCFDDAAMRRNKPSLHRMYGERLAVLTGDALIVMAFQALARGFARQPARLGPVLMVIGRAAGAAGGIAGGQAWECETQAPLAEYQRAKTGALFVAATVAAAAAVGVESEPWRALGELLGEAYQVADDIRDVLGTAEDLGKPVGRDAALGRPSAVAESGLAAALEHFGRLVDAAVDSVPAIAAAPQLRAMIRLEAQRLLPEQLTRRAA
jgi:geranylgeranyl diphosphate synthase type II